MKKLVLFAAALVSLVACNKEEAVKNEETVSADSFVKGQEVTLTVSGPSTTKVTSELNSEAKAIGFKWQTGDRIKVIVGTGSDTTSAKFTLTSGAGAASATFAGTMPASGSSFSVQYPVNTPDITTQTYSSEEAIPHDKMLFTASGKLNEAFTLTGQNAILGLNLWGIDQTISKIVVKNTTSSGTYTLNISGGVTLPTAEASAQAFFIVVPVGSYAFTAEIYDNAATPASICQFTPSAAQTFVSSKVLNMPAKDVYDASVFLLPGIFSISASEKVQFSSGNLQATCTAAGNETSATYSWGLAGHQWDYIGGYAGNTTINSQTVGAVVDMFGWVGASSALTGDAMYGISTASATSFGSGIEYLKADWANTLPQISGRKWQTLTISEWQYLLNTRTVTVSGVSKTSYGHGNVNGKNGLIILPDNWDGTVCTNFNYGTSAYKNTFTESTTPKWSEMESAGCVFLPSAGQRDASSVATSPSYYWSSTATDYKSPETGNKVYAFCIRFESGYLYTDKIDSRRYGRSVRLVCEYEYKGGKYYPGTESEGVKINDVTWAPVNCGYDAGHTYGLLYQWGRKYGQEYTDFTPETMSKADDTEANKDKFGKYDSSTKNWFSGTVDNALWNGSTKGTSDPCPTGWRVPTKDELNSLIQNKSDWTTNTVGGVTQSGYWFSGSTSYSVSVPQVFIPAAGCLHGESGASNNLNNNGDYWSSIGSGNQCYYLSFGSSAIWGTTPKDRAYGFSVRCVRE